MSASHRSIARLPLDIFTDLRPEQGDAESLRTLVCSKLKQRQGKSSESVTTVGQLLKLSPPALLRTLDPVLCHGMCFDISQTLQEDCLSFIHYLLHHTTRRRMPRACPSHLASLCSFSYQCIGSASRKFLCRFFSTSLLTYRNAIS